MKLTLQIAIIITIIIIASHLIGCGLAHSATKVQFCAEMFAMLLLSCALVVTFEADTQIMEVDYDDRVEN